MLTYCPLICDLSQGFYWTHKETWLLIAAFQYLNYFLSFENVWQKLYIGLLILFNVVSWLWYIHIVHCNIHVKWKTDCIVTSISLSKSDVYFENVYWNYEKPRLIIWLWLNFQIAKIQKNVVENKNYFFLLLSDWRLRVMILRHILLNQH